jgi:hypothetical protein
VKFTMGQEVWLLNPRAVKQKVARATISGIAAVHNFHFQVIPAGWLKVDVLEAIVPGADLMFSNDAADQSTVGDIVNGNGIWNLKFVKPIAT